MKRIKKKKKSEKNHAAYCLKNIYTISDIIAAALKKEKNCMCVCTYIA